MVPFEVFREILTHFSVAIADRPSPSAHKNPKPVQREEAANTADWWLTPDRSEATLTNRTRAFVLTYIAVFGSSSLPARGGELSDGSFVWWDNGIMKKLLKDELVVLQDGYFNFTETGIEVFLGREQ